MQQLPSRPTGPHASHPLPEDFVDADILQTIEERYWYPIQEASTLEALLADDTFFTDPGHHVGLYSDHGTVHVRDVAMRAARLASAVDGVLITERSPGRVRFVQGCAVLLAYLHDIGMSPANIAGRKVHAQFATQTVFEPEFDAIFDRLWATDAGGLRSRIEAVHCDEAFSAPLPFVWREVLALSLAHSKSAVPEDVLDEPAALRRVMQRATFTQLAAQAQLPTSSLRTLDRDVTAQSDAMRRYTSEGVDPDADAFAWLVSEPTGVAAFRHDVIDAVRVLRAADALRQRGTTHRTSAGFEVCTDRQLGSAVFAMRTDDDRVSVLVRDDNPMSGAEANLRLVDLTPTGSLRIAVHRGAFPEAVRTRVAQRLGDVIIDIARDALQSFATSAVPGVAEMRIEFVRPHDDPSFADVLVRQLSAGHPEWSARTVIVDEAVHIQPPDLIDWVVRGEPLRANEERAQTLLAQLRRHGSNTDTIDPDRAFNAVRVVKVAAGEQILAPHTAASVVLVPTGPGLTVFPTGGYPPAPHHAWLPMGVTGVVRGAERNARVSADRDVEVIAIPADVFLAEWFRPYEVSALRAVAAQWDR